MVGASGFEPPTSWSRTNHVNPITLYLGVAYGTWRVISPFSVVPILYLKRWQDSLDFASGEAHLVPLLRAAPLASGKESAEPAGSAAWR